MHPYVAGVVLFLMTVICAASAFASDTENRGRVAIWLMEQQASAAQANTVAWVVIIGIVALIWWSLKKKK